MNKQIQLDHQHTPEYQIYMMVVDARKNAEIAKRSMLQTKQAFTTGNPSKLPAYAPLYRLITQIAGAFFFTVH